jgi:hypothetical protein
MNFPTVYATCWRIDKSGKMILKELISDSIDAYTKLLKERIAVDILNSELAILYRYRIYGSDVEIVREAIAEIAGKIDDIFSKNQEQLLEEINQLLEERETSQPSVPDVEYSCHFQKPFAMDSQKSFAMK